MTIFFDKKIPKSLNTTQVLVPVILSGGGGFRLWPISREDSPKPFIKLNDGQSLLEKTYRRALNLLLKHHKNDEVKILTVTNCDYYLKCKNELDKLDHLGIFLLEPFSKNTAPAIVMAAHLICKKYGQDAIMLVLPSDHIISDDESFNIAVNDAIQLASFPHKLLVTFGIKPMRPETGFGYIKVGEKIDKGYKVKAFIEKPDLNTAQIYINDGKYYWNSGMLCFSAGKFLKQIEVLDTKLSYLAKSCWQAMEAVYKPELTAVEIPEDLFKNFPDISIDCALMEKSNDIAVISGNFGWRDIGFWGAIRDFFPANANDKSITSNTISVNSNNTYVYSNDRIVALVGVNNLMIIDSRDALLVVNSEETQDVKKVVDILKQKNHVSLRQNGAIQRPWGIYIILEEGPGFKIKRLEVNPRSCLSLQSHKHRSEHWVVVKGRANVTKGEDQFTLHVSQSTFIPSGCKHRLENATNEKLIIIEVQCGEYLGEDDIIRYN